MSNVICIFSEYSKKILQHTSFFGSRCQTNFGLSACGEFRVEQKAKFPKRRCVCIPIYRNKTFRFAQILAAQRNLFPVSCLYVFAIVIYFVYFATNFHVLANALAAQRNLFTFFPFSRASYFFFISCKCIYTAYRNKLFRFSLDAYRNLPTITRFFYLAIIFDIWYTLLKVPEKTTLFFCSEDIYEHHAR